MKKKPLFLLCMLLLCSILLQQNNKNDMKQRWQFILRFVVDRKFQHQNTIVYYIFVLLFFFKFNKVIFPRKTCRLLKISVSKSAVGVDSNLIASQPHIPRATLVLDLGLFSCSANIV